MCPSAPARRSGTFGRDRGVEHRTARESAPEISPASAASRTRLPGEPRAAGAALPPAARSAPASAPAASAALLLEAAALALAAGAAKAVGKAARVEMFMKPTLGYNSWDFH